MTDKDREAKAGADGGDSLEFAALLCSRLCHDLLSPVGAFSNGLELMADETDPNMRERCLALLVESARTSASKLKFFRLAFGSAGGFGDAVPTAEAKSAIEGMFAGTGRVKLGWMVPDDTLSKPATKILLNLALIGGEALVRGGQLDVGVEQNGGAMELVVRAQGQKIVLDRELRHALSGDMAPAEATSRSAAAWMVRALVDKLGGQVLMSPEGEPALLFGVTIPAWQA